MKIAFLACNRKPELFRSDPSYIYRCENLGLELSRLGHEVEFRHSSESLQGKQFDLVVFHRPKNTWRIWLLAKYFRLSGTKVLADFDDLIFDLNFAEFSPGFVNGLNILKKTKKTYLSHQQALSFFDGFTVSTEPLKAHLQSLFPNKAITVIPNAVHHQWLAEGIDFKAEPVDFARPVLSYLPGTRSHDQDFKLIATGLSQFLKLHPQVRLDITGPLSFQLGAELASQVSHHEKVAFAKFHQRFQSTWVNLAPLEDTPFNRCKSALKVLEAAYWGKPTLCSPIPDVLRYRNAGAVLIETPDDICNKLTKLLEPNYYKEFVQNLRKEALKLSDIRQFAASFISLADSK